MLAALTLNLHRSLFSLSLEDNFSSSKACFFSTNPMFCLDANVPDYFTEEDRKFRINMPSDAVALADVKAITLQAGKLSTGKRTAPAPQLVCVGGSAKRLANFYPKVAQCYNQGWDGTAYNWKLEAQLSPDVKLGDFEVIYEGYRGAGDPQFALKGSWSVEYHLEKTGFKSNNSRWWQNKPNDSYRVEYYTYNHGFLYHVLRFMRGILIITIITSIFSGIAAIITESFDHIHERRKLKRMLYAQRIAASAGGLPPQLPPQAIYDINRAQYGSNYDEILRQMEREERRKERKLWWNMFFWSWLTTPATTTVYVPPPQTHWWDPWPTTTTYISNPSPVVSRTTHIYHDNSSSSSSNDDNNKEHTSTSYGRSSAR